MVMNSAFIKTSSPQTKKSGTSLPTPAGADYALTLSLSAPCVKDRRRKIDNQPSIAARQCGDGRRRFTNRLDARPSSSRVYRQSNMDFPPHHAAIRWAPDRGGRNV